MQLIYSGNYDGEGKFLVAVTRVKKVQLYIKNNPDVVVMVVNNSFAGISRNIGGFRDALMHRSG